MECHETKQVPQREAILQACTDGGGHVDATLLLFRRLDHCTHASPCGRLCERLIKAAGKTSISCWRNFPQTPADMVRLYESLADPAFACPIGLF